CAVGRPWWSAGPAICRTRQRCSWHRFQPRWQDDRDGGNRWKARPVAGFNRRRREMRSEEHTSELQSRENLVCRLLLEKKKTPQLGSAHYILVGIRCDFRQVYTLGPQVRVAL